MTRGAALVVGLARNVSSNFERDIRILAEAFKDFNELWYHVVESDSSDDTVLELNRAKGYLDNFNFVSFGALMEKFPNRVERITFCRNSYLEYFFSRQDKFDYLIVADMDGVNSELTATSIASCWADNPDWDAVFPNQTSLYYDIWALRQDAWCPGDCWENYRFLKGIGHSEERALREAVFSKMVNIPRDHEWIPVQSAFGGLAIYKAESFPREYYSCHNKYGVEVCEHVNLHLSPGFREKSLFINPMMLNGGINGHSKKALLRSRIKRRLQKTERIIRKFRDRLGIRWKFSRLKRRF